MRFALVENEQRIAQAVAQPPAGAHQAGLTRPGASEAGPARSPELTTTAQRPPSGGRAVLYWAFKAVLVPVLHVLLPHPGERAASTSRPRGAVIVAANHLSFIDSIFIPLVRARGGSRSWPRPTTSRTGAPPGSSGASGQIPIDRGGRQRQRGRHWRARRVLDEGGVFGIYPEGTRSPDGRLHRGHTGVARLALQTGAPIVPVALVGTARGAAARAPRSRAVPPDRGALRRARPRRPAPGRRRRAAPAARRHRRGDVHDPPAGRPGVRRPLRGRRAGAAPGVEALPPAPVRIGAQRVPWACRGAGRRGGLRLPARGERGGGRPPTPSSRPAGQHPGTGADGRGRARRAARGRPAGPRGRSLAGRPYRVHPPSAHRGQGGVGPGWRCVVRPTGAPPLLAGRADPMAVTPDGPVRPVGDAHPGSVALRTAGRRSAPGQASVVLGRALNGRVERPPREGSPPGLNLLWIAAGALGSSTGEPLEAVGAGGSCHVPARGTGASRGLGPLHVQGIPVPVTQGHARPATPLRTRP